jgi:type IV pilus assembly protein PilV
MTNKASRQNSVDLKKGSQGFTLIEVLITIVILSVGLLGMAALNVGIINGNAFSKNLSTATTCAQDKMDDLRRLGYANTSATNATVTEDYNSITDYAAYKREIVTTVDSPAPMMKTITVKVYWKDTAQSDHLPPVELKTILAR